MDTQDLERRLRLILPAKTLIAVYNLKWPYVKGQQLSGQEVGRLQVMPDDEFLQSFYDLVFHQTLIPLSDLPLEDLLKFDLTRLLPDPNAADYPEQCLGLITLLDQTRLICADYGLRYSRAFFDPIAEQLFRQLVALPADGRPDSKEVWLSRGYTIEDWAIRVLWVWGPPLHSDSFMTRDRQAVKDFLHSLRSEMEQNIEAKDPLAECEEADDKDYTTFTKILAAGPPRQSLRDSSRAATSTDYVFWCIRLLNTHFAIVDFAGRYPWWVRHKGEELSERDRTFMNDTGAHFLESGNDAVFDEIREDVLKGVWKPLPPNGTLENTSRRSMRRIPGERGHGPVVLPRRGR